MERGVPILYGGTCGQRHTTRAGGTGLNPGMLATRSSVVLVTGASLSKIPGLPIARDDFGPFVLTMVEVINLHGPRRRVHFLYYLFTYLLSFFLIVVQAYLSVGLAKARKGEGDGEGWAVVGIAPYWAVPHYLFMPYYSFHSCWFMCRLYWCQGRRRLLCILYGEKSLSLDVRGGHHQRGGKLEVPQCDRVRISIIKTSYCLNSAPTLPGKLHVSNSTRHPREAQDIH